MIFKVTFEYQSEYMAENKELNDLIRSFATLEAHYYAQERELKRLKEQLAQYQANEQEPLVDKPTVVHEQSMKVQQVVNVPALPSFAAPTKPRRSIEHFIGEQVISKIGMLITVIGVGIGVKYAIDHNLISPLMRIILGYAFGGIALLLAFKLRYKMKDFSAVLLSGAMAIHYFVTFTAYEYYGFIPIIPAFVLMLLFTVFTAIAALQYDRQVIAQIGLVGAYAIPILLSTNSGRYDILFGYIMLINFGVMVLLLKRNWTWLQLLAWTATHLIFWFWIATDFSSAKHFTIAFSFVQISFLQFAAMLLYFRVKHQKEWRVSDMIFVVVNALAHYSMSLWLLEIHQDAYKWQGLFTLAVAAVQVSIAWLVFKYRQKDVNMIALLSVLGLSLVTIAIPVQFNGVWVTMLWSAEAALLTYAWTRKRLALIGALSLIAFLPAAFSLLHDWVNVMSRSIFHQNLKVETLQLPFVNFNFANTLFFIVAFALVGRWHLKAKPRLYENNFPRDFAFVLSALALLVGVGIELRYFWDYQHMQYQLKIGLTNAAQLSHHPLLGDYRELSRYAWVATFLLLITSLIRAAKFYKLSVAFNWNNALVLSILLLLAYHPLYHLMSMYTGDFNTGLKVYNPAMWLRFPFYVIILAPWWLSIKQMKNLSEKDHRDVVESLLWCLPLILIEVEWLMLCELMQWKLNVINAGINILAALFAVQLFVRGFRNKLAHFRVLGMIIIGVVLIKTIFVDLNFLSTLAKTFIMVGLGLLMLLVAYIYNNQKPKENHEN